MMIRRATPLDVAAIAGLHVRAWQVAYRGHMPGAYLDALEPAKRAAMWSRMIAQLATPVVVAIAGETLVGFCSLVPSRDGDASPTVGEIAAIYVEPAVWRSGIGSSLIGATLASARQQNFSELTLWVLTRNSPARAFYEAHGFEADGHFKTEERPGFAVQELRYRRSAV
jgi:GNAT superfamily N-acetyltransferase